MEAFFRLAPYPKALHNERNVLYRYDERLGWRPRPGFRGTFEYEPGRPIAVEHNSLGFRDVEPDPSRKGGVLVLGDSNVYGFNAEQDEVFTAVLRRRMPERPVYNLGVSGYGTDQEFLLLQEEFDRFKPEVVLLLVCSNDHDDNSSNRRYGYYKPYFTVDDTGALRLGGVPVPKSLQYYPAAYPRLFRSQVVVRAAEAIWRPIARRRWPEVRVPNPFGRLLLEMRSFVESRGARLAVGYIGYADDDKSFCREHRLRCFETASLHVHKTPSGHWNAQGHREVAGQIERFLRGFSR